VAGGGGADRALFIGLPLAPGIEWVGVTHNQLATLDPARAGTRFRA
jgi:hypothetical protein